MSRRWLPIINGMTAVWLEARCEVVSHFTSQAVLSVLRVSVVKWFSAVLSPRRHGEHWGWTAKESAGSAARMGKQFIARPRFRTSGL